jgi:hypothetical protein
MISDSMPVEDWLPGMGSTTPDGPSVMFPVLSTPAPPRMWREWQERRNFPGEGPLVEMQWKGVVGPPGLFVCVLSIRFDSGHRQTGIRFHLPEQAGALHGCIFQPQDEDTSPVEPWIFELGRIDGRAAVAFLRMAHMLQGQSGYGLCGEIFDWRGWWDREHGS